METNTKAVIASQYVNVVKKFLKQSDVLSARALAYHPDKTKPMVMKNWFKFGDTFVTTGFCVCVSSAILEDPIFQTFLTYRNAKAKLISIDIKEQFYGECLPSHLPNKWHTAILLEDTGHHFIIDATCAQFGNAYVGKLVWDFKTWIETFRSVIDKHILTDFDGNQLLDGVGTYNRPIKDVIKKEVENGLFDNVLTDNNEQKVLSEFLLIGYNLFNAKVLTGQVQDSDLKFINYIHQILGKFQLKSSASNGLESEEYAIIKFDSATALKKFMKFITDSVREEDGILDTPMTLSTLPVYVMTSKSIEEAKSYLQSKNTDCYDFDSSDIHNDSRYLLIKFVSTVGVDVSKYIKHTSNFVSCGVNIFVDFPRCFYNLGERERLQKNNTYVLECNVIP